MSLKQIEKLAVPLRKSAFSIAILMTISSSLISYFMVRNNEVLITNLKNEEQNKQSLIRDVWNNSNNKENRANMAILLAIFSNNPSNDIKEVKKDYLSSFSELTENSTIVEVIKVIAKEKKADGDYIDNLYIEQLSIENKIIEVERKNKLYSQIAFFLQIISLIIIINRHPHHNL